MLNFIGFLGSMCFLISALPQAYHSWKNGHSRGMSRVTIILIWSGSVCSLIFLLGATKAELKFIPLIVNYLVNTVAWTIVGWFSIRERKS